MKKYKKILDEKNKNKKISKGEYQSTIIEVNKQINKLSKPKPKAEKKKKEKKDLGTATSKPVKKKEPTKLIPKKKKEAPKKAKETKAEPKKGRKKTVKMLTLAKGQGTSTKIGNVVGPDGKSYEPSKAAQLWEARGFKRVELSKADLKKTEKLAVKYGPFGKYGLGNQLESFLKNKF